MEVEHPITVAPTEDQKGGSMLTFLWKVTLRYFASPESPFGVELGGPFGPGETDPFTPTDIRFSIHKSPLASEDFVTGSDLDYDFTELSE
jgi:hypothetical protein